MIIIMNKKVAGKRAVGRCVFPRRLVLALIINQKVKVELSVYVLQCQNVHCLYKEMCECEGGELAWRKEQSMGGFIPKNQLKGTKRANTRNWKCTRMKRLKNEQKPSF